MAPSRTFSRFVESGRVCLVNYGSDLGKLCVIVEIIDHNKVLVDGTTITGVKRQSMPLKRLSLTDQKIELAPGSKTGAVFSAMKSGDVMGTWGASAWAKKIAIREKRAGANDFKRFEIGMARAERSKKINKKK